MSWVVSRLERWLLGLVCAGALLGVAWPTPARHAADGHGLTIALIVLVASVGFGLDAAVTLRARHQAGRITLAVVGSALGLPLIAYVASRAVGSGPLRLGVLAVGVAPSEVASVALAALAGGSAAVTATVGDR